MYITKYTACVPQSILCIFNTTYRIAHRVLSSRSAFHCCLFACLPQQYPSAVLPRCLNPHHHRRCLRHPQPLPRSLAHTDPSPHKRAPQTLPFANRTTVSNVYSSQSTVPGLQTFSSAAYNSPTHFPSRPRSQDANIPAIPGSMADAAEPRAFCM